MIDYILRFASRSAATQNALIRQHMNVIRDMFSCDRVICPLSIWRDSQDSTTGTDEDGNPIIQHSFIAGFTLMVSLDRIVPALRDATAVQLVVDRDLANSRQSGAVIRSTIGSGILNDIRWSPVPAGADYPWGAWP